MEKTEQPIVPPSNEPSSFRLIATLGVAGLVSGMCLVGAFLYTEPLILAAKARALEAAVYEVLPGCSTYEVFEWSGGKLEKTTGGSGSGERVFLGYASSGEPIGYAVQAQVPGFQDVVAGIFGYIPESKTIIGFKVLESKETPGLGDKIIKDQAFLKNFEKLAVEPEIVLVKAGQKANSNEVDAITGATISSRAVVSLLNKGVNDWKPRLEKRNSQK